MEAWDYNNGRRIKKACCTNNTIKSRRGYIVSGKADLRARPVAGDKQGCRTIRGLFHHEGVTTLTMYAPNGFLKHVR